MATLSTFQRGILSNLNSYLRGAPNLPVDQNVVEQLAKIYDGTPGFRPSCGVRGTDFRTAMLTEPIRSFIKMLISTSDGPSLNPCSGGGNDVIPVPPGPGPIVCPSLIPLLTAATYGVISSTPDVSNTGNTTISGNVAVSPAASVVGFPPGVVINGSIHAADTAAAQARADLTAAYIVAAALPGATVVGADIGGTTLGPGIYSNASSLAVTTGDVIFDGHGDVCSSFIFQIGSSFTLSNSRKIILVNGARAANIYFQVGSSATLGTNSVLNGTILALTSITANTGATINGRLLARNGEVTLDTNVVVIPS